MKQHYEEKLNMLSAKITNTQKERDQVLANMGRKLFFQLSDSYCPLIFPCCS